MRRTWRPVEVASGQSHASAERWLNGQFSPARGHCGHNTLIEGRNATLLGANFGFLLRFGLTETLSLTIEPQLSN
jgi:hypothetical protein